MEFVLVCNWTDPALVHQTWQTVDWSRAFEPKLRLQNAFEQTGVYRNLPLPIRRQFCARRKPLFVEFSH